MSTQIVSDKNYVIAGQQLIEIGDALKNKGIEEEQIYINQIPRLIESISGGPLTVIKIQTATAQPIPNFSNTLGLYDSDWNKLTKGEIKAGQIYYIATESTTVDLREKDLTLLEIIKGDKINKLICFDNQLTELNLSNCPNLQFLHMQENPICDNEDYLNNLVSCINNLPDRTEKSCGSIVFTPWIGQLPILFYTEASNNNKKYWKYPHTSKQYCFDATQLNNIYNTGAILGLVPTTEELVSDTEKSQSYYTTGGIRFWYFSNKKLSKTHNNSNGTILDLNVYQRLYDMRRQLLEPGGTTFTYEYHEGSTPPTNKTKTLTENCNGTLSKNWLFGSAIQYSDEWDTKCPRYFRDLHIADFWETAEYGFGINQGIIDYFNSSVLTEHADIYLSEVEHLETNADGEQTKIYSNDNHGNSFLYYTGGQGNAKTDTEGNIIQYSYGIAPHAHYIINPIVPSDIDKGKGLTEIDFPVKMDQCIEKGANCFSFSCSNGIDFNVNNIKPLLVGTTYNEVSYKNKMKDFGTQYPIAISAGNNGIDGPWVAIQSIHEKTFGNNGLYCTGFNKYGARFDSYSSLKNTDFLIAAGPGAQYVTNNIQKAGTSNVSPLIACYLGLLRNVYYKLSPEQMGESTGINSDFMSYVSSYWSTPISAMNNVSNFGFLDILAEPNSSKHGCTEDFNYNYLAKSSNGFTRIRYFEGAQQITSYSNNDDSNTTIEIENGSVNLDDKDLYLQELYKQQNLIPMSSVYNWTQIIRFNINDDNLSTVATTPTKKGMVKVTTTNERAYVEFEDHKDSTNNIIKKNIYRVPLSYYNDGAEQIMLRDILEGADIAPYKKENGDTLAIKKDSAACDYSWLMMSGSQTFFTLNSLKQLHFDKSFPAVIAIVCEENGHLTFYYNGTKIKEYDTQFNKPLKIDKENQPWDNYLNTNSQKNSNSAISSYCWNEVLSQDDIINYTICLLNT